MKNIALKLMYNGAAYHGWQVQKDLPTVAETLEKALSSVCGSTAAARTRASTRSGMWPISARTPASPASACPWR